MNRVDVRAAGQCLCDLVHAVPLIGQQHDLNFPRPVVEKSQILKQLFVVLDAGVEKNELTQRHLRHVRRAGRDVVNRGPACRCGSGL